MQASDPMSLPQVTVFGTAGRFLCKISYSAMFPWLKDFRFVEECFKNTENFNKLCTNLH